MKAVVTTSEHLQAGGHRLDGSYHASDGVEALRFIRQWAGLLAVPAAPEVGKARDRTVSYGSLRLDALEEVCVSDGVFIPSRFKRIFVDDPEHGAPYLTGGSIMQADPLMGAKLLSYRFTQNMDELALHERMILVTCSGTIGNSVYVNANFTGAVGSPDLLRVVADPDRIPPGYLYAFLCSHLGKALIEQKTYGAVVSHIEAHHVTDLPIPRLEPTTEERIHQLIEQAASLWAEENDLISEARQNLLRENQLPALTLDDFYFYGSSRVDRRPGAFVVSSSQMSRLTVNAWNYGDKFESIRRRITEGCRHLPLSEVLKPGGYFTGSWYKRIPTSQGHGVELLTQKQLFSLRKEGNWISLVPIRNLDAEKVTDGMMLIAGVGTMGETEVFGRCEFAWKSFENKLVVAEVIRVVPDPACIDPGYLFAYLSSDYGFRLLRSTISGTKLCRFIEPLALSIPVPLVTSDVQKEIGDQVRRAYGNRADALVLEDKAQSLLAETLEYTIRQ